MPGPVRVARVLLAGVAIAHAVAIALLLLLQGLLISQISTMQPGLTAEDLSKLVAVELVRTGSFHALLVVVCGIYAVKIGSRSKRVFRIIVASQVLSVIFGITTWFISPDVVRFITVPFILAALVILLLLVGSRAGREFFKTRYQTDADLVPPR
ncbi:hypothetical protein [Psychromicrobium lacuslunae]|uniref:Uncharacterized protein n=1 Tax=Psychromicrobium lacuslunae TaxID=1618207 RepID=A0A0D4BZB4_9MICC|nr:hypothetical protein [Psychromicrobium lacuslunae]AJT41461.1 hypothetical protein UM93_07910 [Psychromicrobium lacuslunae]